MKRLSHVLLCLVALGVCASTPARALYYTLHDIGTFDCRVAELNDSGQFTGITDDVKITRYDIYGGKTVLDSGFGRSVNNSGQIAGYSSSGGGTIYNTDGTKTRVIGEPYDINNSGGYCGISGSQGYFHDSQGTHYIASADGSVQAQLVNDSGTVAGNVAPTHGYIRAFVWSEAHGLNYLTGLGGMGLDIVHGINSQGYIAGQASAPNSSSHAVVWKSDGSVRDLTPSGWGEAWDINNAGYVVGNRTSNGTPCVWTPSGQVIYLPKLAGATVSVPYAINNLGTIVGYCYMPNAGWTHIVTWTPVPEPACVLVLLSGVVGLAFSRPRTRKPR